MANISYQLYCSRNFGPLEATLSMLADAGYASVEGFGGLYADPAALRGQLDAAGLTMPTGHFGLDVIEGTPDDAIATAKTLGVSSVFVPYLAEPDRPTDAAGWAAFGKRLAEAGKPILDAGLAYGWHNHDFEFADVGSASLPMELILEASDDVKVELDLGWVARAGHDMTEWVGKLSDRIISAHIKDIAPDGENTDEDGWADVGHGRLDWAPVHTALKAAGVDRYVIEHDNPADDARFAARSLATVKGW